MLKNLIKKFKDNRIEKRLFKNKLQKDKFINSGIESLRAVYLRQVHTLREYYQLNSKPDSNYDNEILSRQNSLKQQGLIPPKSLIECDRFSSDIRNYKS